MQLIASIFASDILPIFIVAGVGFVLARRLRTDVKTIATVSFNAVALPRLYQLVTAKISGAQSIRVAAFCVLLTLAIGIAARLTSLPLRLIA
jgi:predicted permease